MQTRMGLELAGYTVVDTELVNAEVRLRLKRTREDTVGKDMERIHEELSDSRAWTQLAPGEQRELLTELGVDGVLQASIVMGYSTGAFEERVTIRLAVEQLDGTVAWRADCGVRTEGDEPRDVMIERVGRCALDSEAMW